MKSKKTEIQLQIILTNKCIKYDLFYIIARTIYDMQIERDRLSIINSVN